MMGARSVERIVTEAPLRRILHVDMDAFYASVEQRDDPALRGRPVAVGGRPESARRRRARRATRRASFGVRSAMPMARAVRLCPELVVVPPDFAKYGEVSRQVFAIFRDVTPLVEPLSLDEAYLDVTENAWGEPLGVEVARRLKRRDPRGDRPHGLGRRGAQQVPREDRLGLEEARRTDGHRAGARRAFLQKLPVDALWGVGPVTAGRLRAAGIDAAGRRADRGPGSAPARRRQLGRMAAPARVRRGRPAGRAEPRAQVRRLRGDLRAGPRRPRADPQPRSRRSRATPRPSSRARSSSPAR